MSRPRSRTAFDRPRWGIFTEDLTRLPITPCRRAAFCSAVSSGGGASSGATTSEWFMAATTYP
jgi:hypothetical protein